MRQRLENITLRAFKTIKEIEDFSLGPITVLIGPNGAGKSNFISFFRMLSWAVATPGTLQEYIARQGGASALLHDGPGRTRDIEAHLSLKTEAGRNDYAFRLAYASGDTLIYTEEKYRFSRAGLPGPAGWTNLETGHREARLIENAEHGDVTARTIHSLQDLFNISFTILRAPPESARSGHLRMVAGCAKMPATLLPFFCA